VSQVAVMDREGTIHRHDKPKKVTVYETLRVMLKQNSNAPVEIGDFTLYAVASSGAPDSPPFYFVGQHKIVETLWICHCKDFRFRGDESHDCSHIEEAKRAAS
jgi:hypothetical protein